MAELLLDGNAVPGPKPKTIVPAGAVLPAEPVLRAETAALAAVAATGAVVGGSN